MAELVLLPEADHPRYEEGDILCAFSDARIGEVHASHICHPRQFGFNSDGLREQGTLLERKAELGSQYRFTRVTSTFIIKEDLRDPSAEIEVCGLRPNAKGEFLDVREFLRARKLHPTHQIFGLPNHEVWYGGQWTLKVDQLWSEIESRTTFRRVDYRRWPLSERERKRFLTVSVGHVEDQWLDPLTDGDPDTPTTLKLRAFGVDWKNLILPQLGGRYTLDDFFDVNLEKELRDLLFNERLLVARKAQP